MKDNYSYTGLLVVLAAGLSLLACGLTYSFGSFLKTVDLATLINSLP